MLETVLQSLPAGYLILDQQATVLFATETFGQVCQPLPRPGQNLDALPLPAEVIRAARLHQHQQLHLLQDGAWLAWLLLPLPEKHFLISVREDLFAFKTLIDNSPDIISRYDLELRCLYINQSFRRYIDMPVEQHIGKSLEERGIPWQISDALRHNAERARNQGLTQHFVSELNMPDIYRVFESRLIPEYEAGTLVSYLCLDRDITEFHATRLWEADENRLLEMIANNRPLKEVLLWTCQMLENQINAAICCIMQSDKDGRLQIAASPSLDDSYRTLLVNLPADGKHGMSSRAALQRQMVIIDDMSGDASLPQAMQEQALASCLRAGWSMPITTHDGMILGTLDIYRTCQHTPTEHEQHISVRTSHLLAIAIQQTIRDSELIRLATQDSLTGLPNRRHFIERASEQWQQARLHGRPISLLMFDLDHFKQINDHHGHEGGDLALQAFAQCMQSALRSNDLLCRMGGEEFAAVLLDTPADEALTVANRVCKATALLKPVLDGQEINLTVSVGIAANHRDHRNLGDLIRHADHALYQAKRDGRNRCHLKK